MDNTQVLNYVLKNKYLQLDSEKYCLQKWLNQLRAKRVIVRNYKSHILKRNLKLIQNCKIRREHIDSYKEHYKMNFPIV